MNVLILGGFLGSGKTTVLLQLARYLIGRTDPDRANKVMIIENEVGQVGVDDGYLRGGGLQVENLFAGCACCSLAGELVSTLDKIREQYDPAWVIIETTGIAMPGNIQMTLEGVMGLKSRILVLADAQRWQRLRVPLHDLLWGQIAGSDAVLINKCDLVDPETLDQVEREVRELDGKMRIFRVTALETIDEAVWQAALGQEETT